MRHPTWTVTSLFVPALVLGTCPAGARVFGDLADPESDIRWVIANKRVFVLKEDHGTVPRFFYYFAE